MDRRQYRAVTEGVSLFFLFIGDLLNEQGHDTVMIP